MSHLEEELEALAEPGLLMEVDLKERVRHVERLLALLLSDEVIGNVLKGPLRVPPANIKNKAFQ